MTLTITVVVGERESQELGQNAAHSSLALGVLQEAQKVA